MRKRLQPHYDAKGLGAVPQPEGRGERGQPRAPRHAAAREARDGELPFRPAAARDHARPSRRAGIFIISSATTVAEARTLEQRGVDAIIAQGTEAGGHRGTFTGVDISMQPGLFALLPQVVDAVRVPVIAAGGIADGRQVAAAFMLGASAVQLGTAFLRCEEANVQDAHRAALREANDACTIVTDMLTGRPARYIRNSARGRSHRLGAGAGVVSRAAELDGAAAGQPATGSSRCCSRDSRPRSARTRTRRRWSNPLPRRRRAVCRHSTLDHLKLPRRVQSCCRRRVRCRPAPARESRTCRTSNERPPPRSFRNPVRWG